MYFAFILFLHTSVCVATVYSGLDEADAVSSFLGSNERLPVLL